VQWPGKDFVRISDMLIWVLFAIMLAGVLVWLLGPLKLTKSDRLGRAATSEGANAYKAEYHEAEYRAEINIIAQNLARASLDENEARLAYMRAGRQLLQHDADGEPGKTHEDISPMGRRALLVLLCTGVPVAVLALYLAVGRPDLARLSAQADHQENAPADLVDLIAALETRVMKVPADHDAWTLLASGYSRTGRFVEARHAFNEVLSRGRQAPVLAAYGEMLVWENQGIVGNEAQKLFEEANHMAPSMPAPRYYLGLAHAQDGDAFKALLYWEKLLAELPSNAPLRPELESRVREMQNTQGDLSRPAPR
jgi:cytochrome c-type biogenesis protein CcmH